MAKADRPRRGDWNDHGPIAVCAECECAFRTEREPQLSTNRIFCVVCAGLLSRGERRYAEGLDGLAHARDHLRRFVTPEQRVAEEAAKDIKRRAEWKEIVAGLEKDGPP
jgi:hypothetical protein